MHVSLFGKRKRNIMSKANGSIYSESNESVVSNIGVFFLLFGAVLAFAFGISYFQK